MDIKYHAYGLGEIGKRGGSSDTGEIAVQPDRGGDLAPSCLSCPFAVCQYDWPDWKRRQLAALPRAKLAVKRFGTGSESPQGGVLGRFLGHPQV